MLSIGLTFLTGDARLFLIRESFLTVFFGIICLISLLFPKPIWFYIIRYFTASTNHEQMVAYDAAWKFASFRGYIRTVTILWGVVYTVEFLIRLVMVYTLSISQVLVISSIIFYAITILATCGSGTARATSQKLCICPVGIAANSPLAAIPGLILTKTVH